MNRRGRSRKAIGAIAVVISLAAGGTGPVSCLRPFSSRAIAPDIPSYGGFSEIDPAKNHFTIVGDTQATSRWEFWRERNDPERRRIADEIARRSPAFVVHLGDLTTRGSSTSHWRQFDDFHATARERRIPYFPVLGNHEFYGSNRKAMTLFYGRFPHLDHRRWYSFAWKKIGLILLDSNFSTLSPKEAEEQEKWYLNELKSFEERETIDDILVFCHEPPYTNNRVVGASRESEVRFAEPFAESSKGRFFFSGHSHTYERFERKGKFFIVSGGGGGPRHQVNVNPLTRRFVDLFAGTEVRVFHFCEIEVNDAALSMRMVGLQPDGTFAPMDAVTLHR